jgi:TonB family protein
MRAMTVGCLLLLAFAGCSRPVPQLFPSHIETPSYPGVARVARITGKVVLLVTIDADGNVIDAKAANDDKWVGLLKIDTIDNIRHWTFAKPSSAPYTQTITYDYEFDSSLPQDYYRRTKVNFDLPRRVTILTNESVVEP